MKAHTIRKDSDLGKPIEQSGGSEISRRLPMGLVLAAVAGSVLLVGGLYLLILLQSMNAKMSALPLLRGDLARTNDQLGVVSKQLDQVNGNVRDLSPFLGKINASVAHISIPLNRVNSNVQGTAPTLQRMDQRLAGTVKRLDLVDHKLDGLQKPMDAMEETIRRMRKVLPR